MRTAQPADYPDGYESYVQKGWRKCKEQPVVPLGTLATVAAFVGASRAARTQDQAKFQRYLRLRVAAQGVTILGAVIGAWYIGYEARKLAKEQEVKTGRVVRETQFDGGLAQRIKEAERLSDMEERIEKRPPAAAAPQPSAAPAPPPPSPPKT